ncbi:MAG: hypothetical protein NTU74_00175 [Deltaproteobacteria bacterium]|nr:hypothetical protein [Deltaproteobacteria bacterium]
MLHGNTIQLTQPLSVKYSGHDPRSKAEFTDMMLIPFGKLFGGKNIIGIQSDHLLPKRYGNMPLVHLLVDQRQGPPCALCNPWLPGAGQGLKDTAARFAFAVILSGVLWAGVFPSPLLALITRIIASISI